MKNSTLKILMAIFLLVTASVFGANAKVEPTTEMKNKINEMRQQYMEQVLGGGNTMRLAKTMGANDVIKYVHPDTSKLGYARSYAHPKFHLDFNQTGEPQSTEIWINNALVEDTTYYGSWDDVVVQSKTSYDNLNITGDNIPLRLRVVDFDGDVIDTTFYYNVRVMPEDHEGPLVVSESHSFDGKHFYQTLKVSDKSGVYQIPVELWSEDPYNYVDGDYDNGWYPTQKTRTSNFTLEHAGPGEYVTSHQFFDCAGYPGGPDEDFWPYINWSDYSVDVSIPDPFASQPRIEDQSVLEGQNLKLNLPIVAHLAGTESTLRFGGNNFDIVTPPATFDYNLNKFIMSVDHEPITVEFKLEKQAGAVIPITIEIENADGWTWADTFNVKILGSDYSIMPENGDVDVSYNGNVEIRLPHSMNIVEELSYYTLQNRVRQFNTSWEGDTLVLKTISFPKHNQELKNTLNTPDIGYGNSVNFYALIKYADSRTLEIGKKNSYQFTIEPLDVRSNVLDGATISTDVPPFVEIWSPTVSDINMGCYVDGKKVSVTHWTFNASKTTRRINPLDPGTHTIRWVSASADMYWEEMEVIVEDASEFDSEGPEVDASVTIGPYHYSTGTYNVYQVQVHASDISGLTHISTYALDADSNKIGAGAWEWFGWKDYGLYSGLYGRPDFPNDTTVTMYVGLDADAKYIQIDAYDGNTDGALPNPHRNLRNKSVTILDLNDTIDMIVGPANGLADPESQLYVGFAKDTFSKPSSMTFRVIVDGSSIGGGDLDWDTNSVPGYNICKTSVDFLSDMTLGIEFVFETTLGWGAGVTTTTSDTFLLERPNMSQQFANVRGYTLDGNELTVNIEYGLDMGVSELVVNVEQKDAATNSMAFHTLLSEKVIQDTVVYGKHEVSVTFDMTGQPTERIWVGVKKCLNAYHYAEFPPHIPDVRLGSYPTHVKVDFSTAVDQIAANVPDQFSLEQNYPNPFNPITVIQYNLTKASDVNVSIYNTVGQKVRTLVSEHQPAGTFEVTWDANNETGNRVPSGMYIYRIEAGEFTKIRKMTLLK